MTGSANEAVEHYEGDTIDPLFIAGARDALYEPHVRGRVLNVGLGYGAWDERLNRDSKLQVTGLDIQPELVTRFAGKYSGINYICADVLMYETHERFDTIVASHLLEHMEDPVALLRRFASWLKPSGRVIVIVPNANSMHRIIGKEMGLLTEVTDLTEADHKIGHRRVYTRDLLEQDIRTAWFNGAVRNLTFKALSNGQLAKLPRNYVDACCRLHDLSNSCQLGAVLTR
ncbi:class I SAM-dependent methyltransferase [Patescibacteria group bacterium]|nr:class I SAM-dependent methyltransferase [Patescibacteria group bacterium]